MHNMLASSAMCLLYHIVTAGKWEGGKMKFQLLKLVKIIAA